VSREPKKHDFGGLVPRLTAYGLQLTNR